jgi:hypothetical protein
VRSTHLILVAAALGLTLSLPALHSAQAGDKTSRSDTLDVKDLRPKMKGYGLTVFEGTKPERFDVEIIDVLENFRPRQELILIKTSHPRLEVAKVVAGMSGSPIYIDGKMIGAYAYGWTFGQEPVAGVTPIRNMIDDMMRPLPDDIFGWPLNRVPAPKDRLKTARGPVGKARFQGAPENYDVGEHASQLAQRRDATLGGQGAPLTPVSTPLLIGGMTPDAVAAAKDILGPLGIEPLQAGGGGGAPKPGAPTQYEDGGAIGVQMVRGDMSAMGLGTVTRVEGDRLVAFGHPMMEVGVTALPTAIGQVHWFMASQMRSFKIGSPVRPVGALVNDRLASIVVSNSAQAPIVPVKARIRGVLGTESSDWNFEVAHDKFMTPAFLGVALGSALQTAAAERRDVTWSAKSRVRIAGKGELVLEDYGASPTGTPQAPELMRSVLVRAAGALLNNPWENAFIESVDFDIQLSFSRDIQRIRGAELLKPELEPGEPARIRLTLESFGGPTETRVISVPIPRRFAGQTLELRIEPGYAVERERAAPESLDDLIANFSDPVYPARSLVVSFDAGSSGVAHRGRVADNLPPGALDALSSVHSSLNPSRFGSRVRHVVSSSQFIVGDDSVSVRVRPALR